MKRGSPGLRRVRRWGRKASGGREGAPRWRNDGGDFYLQNHAQVSISEVLFPGSRPRGLPAAPPARAGGTPAETFTSKTMLRCLFRRCFFPVLAPVACRRPSPARAGGATATISTSKTSLRCIFRRCFFLIRAPVACRRPPPGASGPPLSRVFTLRGARTGVPHANQATWLSNMP